MLFNFPFGRMLWEETTQKFHNWADTYIHLEASPFTSSFFRKKWNTYTSFACMRSLLIKCIHLKMVLYDFLLWTFLPVFFWCDPNSNLGLNVTGIYIYIYSFNPYVLPYISICTCATDSYKTDDIFFSFYSLSLFLLLTYAVVNFYDASS